MSGRGSSCRRRLSPLGRHLATGFQRDRPTRVTTERDLARARKAGNGPRKKTSSCSTPCRPIQTQLGFWEKPRKPRAATLRRALRRVNSLSLAYLWLFPSPGTPLSDDAEHPISAGGRPGSTTRTSGRSLRRLPDPRRLIPYRRSPDATGFPRPRGSHRRAAHASPTIRSVAGGAVIGVDSRRAPGNH